MAACSWLLRCALRLRCSPCSAQAPWCLSKRATVSAGGGGAPCVPRSMLLAVLAEAGATSRAVPSAAGVAEGTAGPVPLLLLGVLWGVSLLATGGGTLAWWWYCADATCDLCKATIRPRRHLASHQRERCPCRSVDCKLCGQSVRHSRLAHHELHSCPERELACASCQKRVRSSLMAVHREKYCARRFVECPMGCKEWLVQAELGKHQRTTCPERRVRCDACGQQMRAKALKGHVCGAY